MGMPEYYGMKLIWQKEDELAIASGSAVVFSKVTGKHARDFLRARAKNRMGKALYERMVWLSKEDEANGTAQSIWTKDILTKSLATKKTP